jgi:hypothetical protein
MGGTTVQRYAALRFFAGHDGDAVPMTLDGRL